MSDRDEPDVRDEPKRAKRLSDWSSALVFGGVVFVASVVPLPGSAEGYSPSESGNGSIGLSESIGLTDPLHLVGYAVLSVLVSQATGRHVGGLIAAVTVATVFGFGIELVQAPIPWRGFAWRDVLMNAVGASLGGLGIWISSVVRDRIGRS